MVKYLVGYPWEILKKLKERKKYKTYYEYKRKIYNLRRLYYLQQAHLVREEYNMMNLYCIVLNCGTITYI